MPHSRYLNVHFSLTLCISGEYRWFVYIPVVLLPTLAFAGVRKGKGERKDF